MYQPRMKIILTGFMMAIFCSANSVFADVLNELPVKFIRFYANQEGDQVRLRWITESEINNDFYTIERSIDMLNWETLETVPGSPTSPGEGQYEYFDMEPKSGLTYYRIKQTDLNGAYDFSHIEKVEFESLIEEDEEFYVLAPNPVPGSDDSFTIDGESSFEGTTIKLYDITGKEVRIGLDINDSELEVTPFEKLNGLFFITIQKGKKSTVKKIKFE